MSKKNSSVNLRKRFNNLTYTSSIFLKFKNKLDKLKKKKFTVAGSGGPDSLALVALTKIYSSSKKTKFYYVLVDHNIRKDSDNEAQKVKHLLKKNNVNLKIILNRKKITRNIQGEARRIRYEILINYCKKNKINTILTGHNLEDQVETFFIRLSRGSGLKGLSAMKPLTKIHNRVNLYRPLLDIKKDFLIKISKDVFGKFFRDPSNRNLKYLRTKVRNLKKPLEDSGIQYGQIIKSINNLASSKATLEVYFNKIFRDIIKKNKKKVLINFKKFKKHNKEIKIALINESIKILKKNYYNPRSNKVDNLIKTIDKSDFKKSTLGGCIFVLEKENLCLKLEKT